jgi:hypothetical protein
VLEVQPAVGARELEQIGDGRYGNVDEPMDAADHLALRRRQRTDHAVGEQLGVACRRAQGILDVVRHAAQQRGARLARAHDLRALQLGLPRQRLQPAREEGDDEHRRERHRRQHRRRDDVEVLEPPHAHARRVAVLRDVGVQCIRRREHSARDANGAGVGAHARRRRPLRQ